MRTISWLDGTTRFSKEWVGRKGMALQFLKESGQSVPNTFAITSDAFMHFLTENGLRSRLARMVESLEQVDGFDLKSRSEEAQKLVMDARFPWDMEIDLINSYKRISHEAGVVEEDVILRPSAHLDRTREWGLEERLGSAINVKGEAALLEGVKEVWARSLSADALRFYKDGGATWGDLKLSVVVQCVVPANAAGTASTRDPAYGQGKMVVRAILGLGTPLRDRQLNPDTYVLDSTDLKITDRMISDQMWSHLKGQNEAGGKPRRVEVDVFYQSRPKLTDGLITDVARVAQAVERAAGEAIELDFAVDPRGIHILDFRRLTELEVMKVPPETAPTAAPIDAPPFAAVTPPPAAEGASAGSEGGGEGGGGGGGWDMFSVAPAAEEAASAPEPGPASSDHYAPPTSRPARSVEWTGDAPDPRALITAQPGTRIMLVLDAWNDRDRLDQAAALPHDGVAVLGLEGAWSERIRTHPLELVRQRQEERAVDVLKGALASAGRAFGNSPVIVSLLGMDSRDLRSLMGGPSHEAQEDNPLLGLRGASRYGSEKYKRCARMELRSLAQAVGDDELGNLHLLVPCVRTAEEMDDVEGLLSAEGLDRHDAMALFAGIETPSGVYLISDLEDVVDGIVIDVPGLNAAILGIDPENPAFAGGEYDPEDNPALFESLEMALSTAYALSIDAILTGVAPDDSGIIELGIENGADAFAVGPGELAAMTEAVGRAERRFILERLRDLPYVDED